jgi:hypothetical protein
MRASLLRSSGAPHPNAFLSAPYRRRLHLFAATRPSQREYPFVPDFIAILN